MEHRVQQPTGRVYLPSVLLETSTIMRSSASGKRDTGAKGIGYQTAGNVGCDNE